MNRQERQVRKEIREDFSASRKTASNKRLKYKSEESNKKTLALLAVFLLSQ